MSIQREAVGGTLVSLPAWSSNGGPNGFNSHPMNDIKTELIELIEAFAAARTTQNKTLQTWAARSIAELLNRVDLVLRSGEEVSEGECLPSDQCEQQSQDVGDHDSEPAPLEPPVEEALPGFLD